MHETVGFKVLVKEDTHIRGEGKMYAKEIAYAKLESFLYGKGINDYQVNELKLDDNYGLDMKKRHRITSDGIDYIQRYVVYKVRCKIKFNEGDNDARNRL